MLSSIPNDRYDHQITRRGIIIGAAASLICVPAIVRVTNLMPVRRLPFPLGPQSAAFVERLRFDFLERALRSGWDDKRHGPVVGGISESHARRTVAYAQAHGVLRPYISIYRSDEGVAQMQDIKTAQPWQPSGRICRVALPQIDGLVPNAPAMCLVAAKVLLAPPTNVR
jgi:hypothetical protein